jgi:hypothetical protein
VLSPETAAFLESGCALIVGTADAENLPHASRGWGITVLSHDPAEIRLLIDANDRGAVANAVPNAKIAVTGGNVQTLHSVQFKGTIAAVEPGTEDDRVRAERYAEDFFGEVSRVDGTPRETLHRLMVHDVIACIVRIVEHYDQTPGPGAGASIPTATP